jgi:predicted nucleic acid-binding protein
MPLDLPDGSACFIDANVFYYHFVETPSLSDPCTSVLERVADGRLLAHTSIHVLAEAVHKLMLAEAAAKFGLNRAGLVNWLQHHRQRILELSEFPQKVDELIGMGLPIVPWDLATLREAANISVRTGLLTNDAIVVALMRRHGLSHLMTNDDDFDGVPGITVWKPR